MTEISTLSDILAAHEEGDGRTDPAEIVIHAIFCEDVSRTLRVVLRAQSARVLERRSLSSRLCG